MSTPDPLNPAPTAQWAPPAVAPPPPAWGTSTGLPEPGPGFVPYAATGPIRSSRRLATASLTLYWCRTGSGALLALAFANRRRVINTAIDHFANGGITRSDVDADDRARALIGAIAAVVFALTIAAAIVTSLWARRVAENARARGDRIVRPGLATGGWYIPIGWFWVGFNQIKEALSRAGHNPDPVGRWQTMFILATVLSGVTLRLDGNSESLDDLKSASTTGMVTSVITLAMFAVCTILASKAMRSTTEALG